MPSLHIAPNAVLESLGRHMLMDGFHLVMDLEKSHGSWIVDARDGRKYLDFYTFFATAPLGHNHPRLREAAFDWKVRKNLAAGKGEKGSQVIHFREAFHGRSGYTLSLTNTADPRKHQYFPKFPWPRVPNPKLTFPMDLAKTEAAEAEAIAAIEAAVAQNPDDIACLIVEPIQGEGGDNHFRGEFLRQLRVLADRHEFLLIFDEVQTGFGATGKWWAHQWFDVQPDILAFGKKSQT